MSSTKQGAGVRAMVMVPDGSSVGLELATLGRATVGPHDLRIQVHASSVNRADLMIRAGTHVRASSDGPPVAGVDAAGVVTEVGYDVTEFALGDRVMAFAPGGLAEEVVVPAGMALPVPTAWSFEEGAAAVLALLTQHDALSTMANLRPGETVLIHAATSGQGSQASRMARQLGAGLVIGTSRSGRASGRQQDLALDHLVDASRGGFADGVLHVTADHGADVTIDLVGGPYFEENVRAAALGGRIVHVGRLGGARAEIDLDAIARQRLQLFGVTSTTRSLAQRMRVVANLRGDVDIEESAAALRPLIDASFAWTDVLRAHEYADAGEHVGKIVLTVSP